MKISEISHQKLLEAQRVAKGLWETPGLKPDEEMALGNLLDALNDALSIIKTKEAENG